VSPIGLKFMIEIEVFHLRQKTFLCLFLYFHLIGSSRQVWCTVVLWMMGFIVTACLSISLLAFVLTEVRSYGVLVTSLSTAQSGCVEIMEPLKCQWHNLWSSVQWGCFPFRSPRSMSAHQRFFSVDGAAATSAGTLPVTLNPVIPDFNVICSAYHPG
jgi:hypothetical protein